VTGPSLHSSQLRVWLTRIQAGDAAAWEDLIGASNTRLERLARKMLRRYPRVARWEQPEDVLQNALLRLLRSLRAVQPDSVRGFFCLAAEQIRRELLDLVRHYQGPRGLGAHHASPAPVGGLSTSPGRHDPVDVADEDLERWEEFHRAVERLAPDEREVTGLLFYHGATQAEVAELLSVSERTVRRQWQSACRNLHQALGGRLPQP
jgi:RNA polymerase sigma-70 factor (ECF subfamily)